MGWRGNRKIKVMVMLVALAVTFHFTFPPLLTLYVKRVLSDLPGHSADMKRITVHLWRGGYSIDSLTVFKTDGNKNIPFLVIPRVEMSIHWESVLLGKLVTRVHFYNPTVNFITGMHEQPGYNIDWSVPLRSLAFLPINHVRVKDGMAALHSFNTEPPVDIFLRNIDIESQNLTNARDEQNLLPSRIYARAHSSGNGSLSVVMKINAAKQLPDLDMDLKFENVDLQSLRSFLTAYANIDVLRGSFNLYSEVTVLDGQVTGYVKPQLDNFLLNGKTQPFRILMGDAPLLSTDHSVNHNRQLITRVPLEGHITGRGSVFWPRLWNIFRNASIEGIQRHTKDAGILASAQ